MPTHADFFRAQRQPQRFAGGYSAIGNRERPQRAVDQAGHGRPPLYDRHFTDEIGDPARFGLLVDFGGRRHLHQAALILDHRDAVRDDHRLFLVVGDDDKGRAEPALQYHQLELRLGTQLLVQRGERLVEQQHVRAFDQGAGKRHALAATRQLVNFAPAKTLKPGEVEHLGNAHGDFLASHILLAQSEGDVAFDREVRKQRVALEHHVYGPPMRQHRHDVLSAEKDPPFGEREITMRNAFGHVEHAPVVGGQLDRLPLTVGRRRGPQVDDHVEQRAARAPDDLGLGVRGALEVHAAQGAALVIERQVALGEGRFNAARRGTRRAATSSRRIPGRRGSP